MATSAVIGAGSTITITSSSPNVQLGEITGISGLGATRPEQEATHLDSTGVERIGGLQDGNEITITGNYVRDTGVDSIISNVNTANSGNMSFSIVVPTSPNRTYTFSALPLSWQLDEIGPGTILRFTLGIRVSGSVTVA